MNPDVLDIAAHVRSRLAASAESLGIPTTTFVLDRPKDAAHGDVGLGCFPFAKALGKSPVEIAKELAASVTPDEVIESATAVGPFVNLRYRREALAESVVRGVLEGAAPYGQWAHEDKCVVIDFSSPNIAKPFHVGHLRSTVIGAALRRVYSHCGWRVEGINHLGDWGAQFGKVIVAWRRWGSEEDLERAPMRHMFEIYVRFGQEAPNDPSLQEEASAAFRALESGDDNEERAIWRRLREVSLKAFQGPYTRLCVEFDHVTGESFYEDKMKATVRQIEEAGITTLSEGALVVEVDGMPPCILRKTDGTTIYATRDLAGLFYRRDTYGFDRALYVVGAEQRLHFRQLRAVLERLGWPQAAQVEHIDFGLILFHNPDTGRWEKGKTRDGNAIFLSEVLDEAVANARRIIEDKNPELADKEAVAEAIGVSAIVFNDLKNSRVKDVKFDWEEMLTFEGETGPYVQYAGARLASILRKAGGAPTGPVAWQALADADSVLLTMLEYGPTLQRVLDKNEPSILTGLTTRLASSIHSYLREHHVLSAEPEIREARLALVAAARKLLDNGLSLLGMTSPEEM